MKDRKDIGRPTSNIYRMASRNQACSYLLCLLFPIRELETPEPVPLEDSPKTSSNILTTLDEDMCESLSCPPEKSTCQSRQKLCKNNLSHWKQEAPLSLIIKVLKIGLSLGRESGHPSLELCTSTATRRGVLQTGILINGGGHVVRTLAAHQGPLSLLSGCSWPTRPSFHCKRYFWVAGSGECGRR